MEVSFDYIKYVLIKFIFVYISYLVRDIDNQRLVLTLSQSNAIKYKFSKSEANDKTFIIRGKNWISIEFHKHGINILLY